MTARRPCPACLATGAPWGEKDGWVILRCGHCATLFTAGVHDGSGGEEYEEIYARGQALTGAAEAGIRRLVESAAGYRRRGAWLDVGCGAGGLLRVARAAGWEVEGVEVARSAVEQLRAEGFVVWHGECGHEPGRFDVVSLVEVVEHATNPGALMASAASQLRPGGALVVTTPHGRGVAARVLRDEWSVVAPPEHLQLLSARGLHALMRRSDVLPRWTRTEGTDPGELRRRASRGGTAPGPAGADERIALNETLMASRRGRVVKGAANAVLRTLRLGDGLKCLGEKRA